MESKRKWNLDGQTGMTSKNPKLNSAHLLSVAKDIGITVVDGNPNIVNDMLQLDSSRMSARELSCDIGSCDKNKDKGKSAIDADIVGSDPSSSSSQNTLFKVVRMEILTI